MIYCIDPNSEEPIMLINKHIGNDKEEGQGIDGALFQQELLMLDSMGKKRIQVWINSPGGSVIDGYGIYSAILKSVTKVDTYNVGIAASIAAVIFQAGRTKIMSDYALQMFHNPFGGDDAVQLAKMTDSIATMCATRSGKTIDEMKAIMAKTTWLTASESLENSLCDTIAVSTDFNKKRIVATEAKAMYLQGNEILNSILKTNTKTMSLTKVTNKLGLNAEASEDAILYAVDAIETKVKNQANALAEMENSLKEKETELENLKKSVDEYKMKEKAAAEEVENAKCEAEEVKNRAMVTEFAKVGRIKNEAEVIEKWVNTAKVLGHEEAKAMIEALPLNKVAATVTPVSNKLDPTATPTNAMSLMARIQAKNKAKI